jgi:hypothetical protein
MRPTAGLDAVGYRNTIPRSSSPSLYPQLSEHIRNCVSIEVFTAATMKNAVFWDVTSCSSCKNRRCGGTYRLRRQSKRNRRAGNNVISN